jgi:hypothetical protein
VSGACGEESSPGALDDVSGEDSPDPAAFSSAGSCVSESPPAGGSEPPDDVLAPSGAESPDDGTVASGTVAGGAAGTTTIVIGAGACEEGAAGCDGTGDAAEGVGPAGVGATTPAGIWVGRVSNRLPGTAASLAGIRGVVPPGLLPPEGNGPIPGLGEPVADSSASTAVAALAPVTIM